MAKTKLFPAVSTAIALALGLSPAISQAQVLEEVVVTAQAREQVLQDVPISMEVVTGDEILRQGLKDINELSDFSPSLRVDPSGHSGGMQMRGVGTIGANLSFEMAVPIFVDGVHFGRRAQTRAAFIDLGRVEVLRGPQPVYFGQNASAGAISITSRQPTQQWEGRFMTEVGNNGALVGEFGTGGPITDTLGIRVAGRYDKEDGYMRDILTRDNYPEKKTFAGRVILSWTPTDQLNASFKFEYVDYEVGPEGNAVGLKPTTGTGAGSPNGVTRGDSWLYLGLDGVNLEPLRVGISNWGLRSGPLWVKAPPQLRRATGAGASHIVLDGTQFADDIIWPVDPESGDLIPLSWKTWTGGEIMDPWNAYLKLDYELANGMIFESQTAYSRLQRGLNRHPDSGGPFVLNAMWRTEDFKQWSQEFSLTSAPDAPFEWMAMLFWQDHGNDHTSDSWRMEQFRQLAGNRSRDEGTWYSGALSATFNFFNDQVSLDLGGRYTEVKKRGIAQNIFGNWILEEPAGMDPNDPNIIDRPGPGLVVIRDSVRTASAAIWNGAKVVGYTQPTRDQSLRHDERYKTDSFDPQVVLRWRPTLDHSLYARYARAFKSGGFDTAVTGIAQDVREFSYGDETAKSVEVGARGSLWEGRAQYDIALSESNFYDLQLSSPDPGATPPGRNVTRNAAHQRVRALEFGARAAVSDQLRMGITGALMDGKMVSYPFAVCTAAEVDAGTTTDPNAVGICRILGPTGSTFSSIDRSGQDALYTPDWSFTIDADYTMPVLGNYEINLNAKLNHSDRYITGYADVLPMPVSTNLNLNVGFGDQAGSWQVTAWVRNLFETLPEYDPTLDLQPGAILSTAVISPSHFRRYGLKFQYNF